MTSHVMFSQVLDIEFQNVKALYRRAQSFIETGDLISAEMDIKGLWRLILRTGKSRNCECCFLHTRFSKAYYALTLYIYREVKSLHRTLKQSKAESNKRDAKRYTSMFAPSKVSFFSALTCL